jgi:hypothetical protein
MKTHTQHSNKAVSKDFPTVSGVIFFHDLLVGPYILPAHLTGSVYRDFFEQSLPELLEDVLVCVC